MEQTIPTELRNASDKKRLEIRKKNRLELQEFLKVWRFQLRTKGTGWEEPLAVTELERKEMFAFLLCEKRSATEWQAEDLFSRILDEIRSYREEARGRLINEHFDAVDTFLSGLIEKIQKKVKNTSLRELKSLFKDLKKEVEQTQKAVGWLRKRKADWHFGVWQHRWPKILRKNLVSRRIELDTRLQVELGRIFADYLRPDITLETIARLILLAYSAGRLSGLDGEDTRTILTNRVLEVRNIRDNLREAGLQDAASFKKKRRRHERRQ
jgi:hypothetical protein